MFHRPRNIPALVLPIFALSGAAWGNEPTDRLIKILSEGSKDEPADTKAVAQALTDGAKADALVPLWFAPKRQATPLAMAAVNGDMEAVRLLLPGAQLNQAAAGSLPVAAADATRYTPLMVAVCPAVVWLDHVQPELKRQMQLVPVDKGSPAVVRELLAAGADPAARDSRGRTALALAVESCQPVMLRYLLDLGLRDLGAAGPVEPEILMEHPDSSANTTMGFLHRIVCLEELKALLREAGLGPAESKSESKAAPMGMETKGQPAPGAGKRENRSLDWALARTVQEACVVANSSFSPAWKEQLSEAHLQEAKRLLAAGADVNAPTAKGFTTLMTLAIQKKIPAALAALLLVQEGLEVDRTDVNQYTALFYAAERGHTDLVECLLLAGADPLRVDRDGKDALMKAVRFDHPGVVELLLERGGDLTRADKVGKTSLHRVAKGKEVEKLLQARKASAAAGAGLQATASPAHRRP